MPPPPLRHRFADRGGAAAAASRLADRSNRPPARRSAPAAWLLQGYDEYIVAHSDSRRIVDAVDGSQRDAMRAAAERQAAFASAREVNVEVLQT